MDSILSYTPDKTSLLELDFIAKIPKWVTGDGKELVEVGSYDLGDKTKKKLGGEPHYGNRALLTRNAARAFSEMQEAYGKDIPISLSLIHI